MKQLEYLEIQFENFETVVIGANEIGLIEISDISAKICRLINNPNSIVKVHTANSVILQIKNDRPLNDSDHNDDIEDDNYSYTTLYKRLKFNDILMIEANFTDGSIEGYYPIYEETANMSNKYQKTEEDCGRLLIYIAKEHKQIAVV